MAAFVYETDYKDFGKSTSLATDMGTLSSDLSTLNGDFGTVYDDIQSIRSNINFGGWADDVQEILQSFLTDKALAAAQTVKDSMDNGVKSMVALADELKGSLTELAGAQEAYVDHLADEPPINITHYYDDKGFETKYEVPGGSSYTEHNKDWDTWDQSRYTQELAMDVLFGSINSGFSALASITFGQTGPLGGVSPQGSPEPASQSEITFDKNGGSDGRHFTSREDAIAAYMATHPGVTKEEAAEIIGARIHNATLFISLEFVDDVVVAGEQLSEEAAMASGFAEPTAETVEVTDPIDRGDLDDDGTHNYSQHQHTEQEFKTTEGDTTTRTEDLHIEGEIKEGKAGEEKYVPETAQGEAHYETSDGSTFTGDITVTYSNEGESFKKHEDITADKTGEQVAAVDQNQVRDYHSNNFGTDNNITDVTVEQGGMVTGKREQVEDYGRPGMRYVESSEWSYVVPEPGKPVTEGTIVIDSYDSPVTYSYERNNQGQLIETYTYPTRKGEQSQTRVVDEHVYLLRVTDPQGHVKETPIIMDSELGNAEFERQYQNAMIDVGWEARAANYRMNELRDGTNGRDPVIVKNANDENNEYVYQFEFIWPEDYW